MEDLKEKGLKVYNAIFQGEKSVELDEIDYPIRKFSSGIRYVDLEIILQVKNCIYCSFFLFLIRR